MTIYDVRACPSCGSGSVDGNEILGVSYSCPDCGWWYKTGLLGERGTPFDDFDRYCPECRTVYPTVDAAAHDCTVIGVLEQVGRPVKFSELTEKISDCQDDPSKQVRTEILRRTVEVMPDGRLRRRADPMARTAVHEAILEELDTDEYTDRDDLLSLVDVSTDWADEYIDQCLRELGSEGAIDALPGHSYRRSE